MGQSFDPYNQATPRRRSMVVPTIVFILGAIMLAAFVGVGVFANPGQDNEPPPQPVPTEAEAPKPQPVPTEAEAPKPEPEPDTEPPAVVVEPPVGKLPANWGELTFYEKTQVNPHQCNPAIIHDQTGLCIADLIADGTYRDLPDYDNYDDWCNDVSYCVQSEDCAFDLVHIGLSEFDLSCEEYEAKLRSMLGDEGFEEFKRKHAVR